MLFRTPNLLVMGLFIVSIVGCHSSPKTTIESVPIASKAERLPTPARSVSHPKAAVAEPQPASEPVVDSDMTLEQALDGSNGPEKILQRQKLVDVDYYGFDHKLHAGQILVDEDLAGEVKEIFKEIEKSRFPIAKVVPVCRYGWSDDQSMAADNTSGFNYRSIPESKRLSEHAFGRAIDLNPLENPFMDPHKMADYKYDPKAPGTLTATSPPTLAFLHHGWHWGGFWKHDKDYQHFEK